MSKVIISGGGTGGHIFPAIAIANGLKEVDGSIEILFIGAHDRMEMERVPAAGYPIEGLWISGFQRSLSLRNLSFPFKLISSLLKARRIIKSFQPNLVIGVGGYASGPTLQVASKLGIPTLIQEQNSFAGITNRLLANKVNKVCVAYDGMDAFFPKEKLVFTGNPVRKDILELVATKGQGAEHFGLDAGKKILLVMGGSLGARSINEGIASNIDAFLNNDVQLIWQTGKNYFPHAQELIDKKLTESPEIKGAIKVLDFISDMDMAYASCDAIVSRAGALAVSEICCVGKPVILVPSPYVAEDHQTKNAMALCEKNAALLVKDSDTIEVLSKEVLELLGNSEKMSELKRNVSELAKKEATRHIVDEALKLMSKS